MKQSVTVINADDKSKILVGCDKTACEGCKGSMFCRNKESYFTVDNPSNIDVKNGDKVDIDLHGGKTVLSVFISLGLPLILFVPGYYIAAIFTARIGFLFLGGIAGIALGFLIAAIYFHFRSEKYVPTLDKKSEDAN